MKRMERRRMPRVMHDEMVIEERDQRKVAEASVRRRLGRETIIKQQVEWPVSEADLAGC